MSPAITFSIAWEAGPSAQIEVFSPGAETGADAYRLKYTPPFRATIRPPLKDLTLGPGELNPVKDRLNSLVVTVDARSGTPTPPGAGRDAVLEQTKRVGGQLLDLVVPSDVQAELRTPGLFLEMGADEALVEFPWELLHDGEEFLCLKHYVGRFVNVTNPTIPPRQHPQLLAPDALSVLLISVPKPQPRGAIVYERLPGAEAETQAILDTLMPLGAKVVLLRSAEATYDNVYSAIKSGRYHIVHFNGHAYFNSDRPFLSSLVLFDQDMTTGPIVSFFGSKPPVFFFLNACETAAAKASVDWKNRYDIFGLARAFLETGAYLIGSRWKVGDAGAGMFAKIFYSELVVGRPLGRAILAARVACRGATNADDLSWASYLFYGDPRLYFCKSE